jgi:hypothetical protein
VKRTIFIKGFAQLGKLMRSLGENNDWIGFDSGVTELEYDSLNELINRQVNYNGWFTEKNVRQSLMALGGQVTEDKLIAWVKNYSFAENPKKVALIMAGNIPLVGFHDFLAVLLSGHKVVCKLSSDDKFLLPALSNQLVQFVPELREYIEFSTGKIGMIDAVIATGSDNSTHYFDHYFGKYPHIFRKNRTSVAVIDGNESEADFNLLGHDIFDYFGLGCRNVSHLIVPKGFDLNRFFAGIVNHFDVVNNNKYANNYDYNKAVYLMNQLELLDNNFVLLRETTELFSPLSMIHYHFYENQEEVKTYLSEHDSEIQAVVGNGYIPFGQAQCPMLDDYADGIDTLKFLNGL